MSAKVIKLTNKRREQELIILIKRLHDLINDLKFQRSSQKCFNFNLLNSANKRNDFSKLIETYKNLNTKRYIKLYESLLKENSYSELTVFSRLLEEILKDYGSLIQYYDKYKKYMYYITKDKDIHVFNKDFIELISRETRDYNTLEEIIEYSIRITLLTEFSKRMLTENINEHFYFVTASDLEINLYKDSMLVRDYCKDAYNRLMKICDKDCRDVCFHLLCKHGKDDIKHVTLKERFALICGEFNV